MISLAEEHKLIKNIVFRIVKRHIAGSTINSALNTVRNLNGKGFPTTVTFLNEHVSDQLKARYNSNAYVQVIRQISRLSLNSGVSVRLGQIGFALNNGVSQKCMEDIVETARAAGTQIWLEGGPGVDNYDLLKAYREARDSYDKVGVEIPLSYMSFGGNVLGKLRPDDMVRITSRSYSDAASVHEDKARQGSALRWYTSSISSLIARRAKVCVYDPNGKMLAKIAASAKSHKKDLIFGVPLGYSNRVSTVVKNSKLNLEVYVPYGKDWAPYAIYRLTSGRVRDIAIAVLNGKEGNDAYGKAQE